MTITEKVAHEVFDRIVMGDQRGLRLAEGTAQQGDTMILEEWHPQTREYTGRKIETVVTAVRPLPAAAEWAAPVKEEERLQLVQFEPKTSKYTPTA
jgi:hypothetical protein